MHDTSRRLLLRLGVKLMFLIAAAFSIYVLVASVEKPPSPPALHPLHIRLTDLPANDFQRIPWQNGNLILLHRDETVRAQLGNHDRQLHDPRPLPEPQDIYIAFDRGSGLGCPLQWIAPGAAVENAPLRPWPGGFRDSCNGTWYDAAGRVFKGQETGLSLVSPAYRLIGELLEIGTNSDNPASAN